MRCRSHLRAEIPSTFTNVPTSLSPSHQRALPYNARQRKPKRQPKGQYEFLLDGYIDLPTLQRSEELAERWHVPPHHVMISMGWLSHKDYTQALAEYSGLDFFEEIDPDILDLPVSPNLLKACYRTGFFRGVKNFFHGTMLSSYELYPQKASQLAQQEGNVRRRIALVNLHKIRKSLIERLEPRLTKEAILGLERRAPKYSARQGVMLWQSVALSLFLGSFLGFSLLGSGLIN